MEQRNSHFVGGEGRGSRAKARRHAVDNLILREDNRAIDANESRISANFAKIIASQTWAYRPTSNLRTMDDSNGSWKTPTIVRPMIKCSMIRARRSRFSSAGNGTSGAINRAE